MKKIEKQRASNKFTGFTKKGCISFVNEKANFAMDSCYHYFGNNLTSSFHTN